MATLITARSSGASYLNRMELQNGCLTRGHANLFIPSTLNGYPVVQGKLDDSILNSSLRSAIDVYIERVDGSPCGNTVIHLLSGTDSSNFQKYRSNLKLFLKGTKAKKAALQASEPAMYSLFEEVWKVRNDHIVQGYPSQYVFFLIPYACFKPSCLHPVCKQSAGKSASSLVWYPGGPSLTALPMPKIVLSRPWGLPDCDKCKGFCNGHYIESFKNDFTQPPSVLLSEAFKSDTNPNPVLLAQKVCLPIAEVEIWLNHLQTVKENRALGAEKRKKKVKGIKTAAVQKDPEYFCNVCGHVYEEETEEVQNWIACDVCSNWFHYECVGIATEPERFQCSHCV